MFKRYLAAVAAVSAALIIGTALTRVPEPAPAPVLEESRNTEETPVGGSSLGGQPSSAVAAQPPSRSYEAPPSSSQPQSGYYIKDWGGRVSIIKEGEEVPEMIFDIYTKLLPEYDQEQLREGLYVASYEELTAMIEDYIS